MTAIDWPNLFIIGAPRAGTTALYDYARQHPDIFMSPAKEPGFFALDGPLYDLETRDRDTSSYFVTTLRGYRDLFRHRACERVCGDATPHYLYEPKAPLRVRRYVPGARIVAILRSPAARAHSAYMMGVRDEGEARGFDDFMRRALENPVLPAAIVGSFYAAPLARWFDACPRERILVLLTEDLAAEPRATMARLFRFLEVDDAFVPDMSVKPNRSGAPYSRVLHSAIGKALDHRIMKCVHRYGPKGLGHRLEGFRNRYFEKALRHRTFGAAQERFYNRAFFGRDVEKVAQLTRLDLSVWPR